MKHYLSIAAAAALMLASCTGKTNNAEQTATQCDETAACTTSIVGKWCIDNIVLNDTLSVRPADVDSAQCQYITFAIDSTYSIKTNCNIINGNYTANGDSLSFGMGMMTRMACPDMRSEDYLSQILPNVRVADFENDSIVRLNTEDPAQYIVLRKCAGTKCGNCQTGECNSTEE